MRAWRAAHPGYQAQKLREWKARNPEKVREAKRKRGRGYRTATKVAALMKAQRGRCAYCREKLGADFHVDHIVPRSAGGSNKRANLQLACSGCNIAKGAKDPVEFAQSIGLLV